MASALSSLLTGKRPLSTKDQKSNFKQWLDSAEKEEEAKIAECPSAKKSRPSSDKWWELPEQKLTPEVRRDLQIIQSRSYLDPKRFYKVRLDGWVGATNVKLRGNGIVDLIRCGYL
jgi:Fcf2 pre-rRNA processing